MSHLVGLKFGFKNSFYLKKALNYLDIAFQEQRKAIQNFKTNLIIFDFIGSGDIEFGWNGQEYELIVDETIWNNSYFTKNRIEKIIERYVYETTVGEGQKIHFEVNELDMYQYNANTLLILETFSF